MQTLIIEDTWGANGMNTFVIIDPWPGDDNSSAEIAT